RPGQGYGGPGGVRSDAPAFKLADASAIARQIPGVAAVAPVGSRPAQVIASGHNRATSITGTTPAFLAVRAWPIDSGRVFTPSEERSGSAVCLLGATVKEDLFGRQDPVGAQMRVGQLSCTVIGLLEAKGESSFGTDQDDLVLVPLRFFQRRIAGNLDVS